MEKQEQQYEDKMLRILSTDIEGRMTIYSGLTKIKGISWGFSNALCHVLKLEKTRKMGSLTQKEIDSITAFIADPKVPSYMLNREKDFTTGEDQHIVGSTLELKKEFDIKRLKGIKSYRGFRHMLGLPSRGQRTKSNFRKNRKKGAGIKKKNKK